MGYLTTKYKGKYRLKCEVDKVTNDFPKTLKDTYEDADVYIDCSFGNRIFYYGKGILQSYIPSLQRGRNIIRKLYAENINQENVSILKSGKGTTYKIIDHKQFNSDIKNSKFIFDILETNSEVMFKFYEKNSDKIIPLLKPKTAGADISPFSPKNLPKIEYLIPKDELREYEDIIAPLKEDGKLLALSKLTQNYIKLLSKKRLYRGVDMKTYMRKKMLKGKEFIHSEGHWNDYLKYLTKEIPNA